MLPVLWKQQTYPNKGGGLHLTWNLNILYSRSERLDVHREAAKDHIIGGTTKTTTESQQDRNGHGLTSGVVHLRRNEQRVNIRDLQYTQMI